MAMRMRATLLLSLVSVSFGLAALSLLAVHKIVEKQIRQEISSDLERSIVTFQNIQAQRRQMLSREASLLADLPVLKSLMTTEDGPTIRDGAKDVYRLSGREFFALADANGDLVIHCLVVSPDVAPHLATEEALLLRALGGRPEDG